MTHLDDVLYRDMAAQNEDMRRHTVSLLTQIRLLRECAERAEARADIAETQAERLELELVSECRAHEATRHALRAMQESAARAAINRLGGCE
jgi:hypothetical protein